MIYLNCAATSVARPACVVEAVSAALTGLGSSSRGTAEGDLAAARTALTCRMAVADLLGSSHPDRVVFTANATQALNTAIFGIVRAGDRVVTTVTEHNSVLRPLNVLERDAGVSVERVGLDGDFALDYGALERAVAPGARAVVCSHASNLTGDVVDIERVAAIAHAAGALLIVDAAQTAGHIAVDMEGMGADVLCFTGHKALLGPTGTGGLIAAPGVEIESLLQGGTGVHSADRFQPDAWPEHLEAGTLNGHGIAGLEAAVRYLAQRGIDDVSAYEEGLRRRFVEGARSIPGAVLYGAGDAAFGHTPVAALNLDGVPSSQLADLLASRYGIATRAGLHCAPLMHRALGTLETGSVRFSFGQFTTVDEIDAALMALAEISAGEVIA